MFHFHVIKMAFSAQWTHVTGVWLVSWTRESWALGRSPGKPDFTSRRAERPDGESLVLRVSHKKTRGKVHRDTEAVSLKRLHVKVSMCYYPVLRWNIDLWPSCKVNLNCKRHSSRVSPPFCLVSRRNTILFFSHLPRYYLIRRKNTDRSKILSLHYSFAFTKKIASENHPMSDALFSCADIWRQDFGALDINLPN